MKKICLAAALLLILTLPACGKQEEKEAEHISQTQRTENTSETTATTAASESTTGRTTAATTTTAKQTTAKSTTKKTTAKTTAASKAVTTTKAVTSAAPPPVTQAVTEQPVQTETQYIPPETEYVPPETEQVTEQVTEQAAPQTQAATEKVTEKAAEPAETSPEAPAAPLFLVNTGESETLISWDAVYGAQGYEVWLRRSAEAEWELLLDTTGTGCSVTGIGIDKSYCFKVTAYKTYEGKRIYSERPTELSFPYLTQKDGVTYVDGLLVVNKTYALPSTYGWGLTAETQAAFNEMQRGAAADGLSIWICSGYRSYYYQNTLYWNYVARDGSQWSADRYSARAGHSEHQSGLAIDVNQASRYFNGSPVAVWLEKNCWKYGFIIRYPYGKEDVTGYNYESWHCRYVGREKAKRLTESGLTIEEYYGLTSVYS